MISTQFCILFEWQINGVRLSYKFILNNIIMPINIIIILINE